MSWFMFFAPSSRLTILEGIWIDETINEVQWNKFISKQQEDWQTYVGMVRVLQPLSYHALNESLQATVLCTYHSPYNEIYHAHQRLSGGQHGFACHTLGRPRPDGRKIPLRMPDPGLHLDHNVL
jgi:hypothetical protein